MIPELYKLLFGAWIQRIVAKPSSPPVITPVAVSHVRGAIQAIIEA
jgi:hypothetical protein